MYLDLVYRTRLARDEPGDFVRTAEIEVREYGEFVEEGTLLVGLIQLKHVPWGQAEDEEWNRWDLCDLDSQDLADLFECLMDNDGELRTEFCAEKTIEHLVVIDRILLHPEFSSQIQHILATAIDLFGKESLVVTWRKVIPASDKQLAQLGFKKAAETHLIFRHTAYAIEYDHLFPAGYDEFAEAVEEHEEWIKKNWGQRCFD
jgi:hypothetical protein